MYGKKSRGSKIFGNEGEGRFREILSCPPQMRVAPQMPPPQIPRPGAATVAGRHYIIAPSCSKDKLWNALADALNDVCRYYREIHKFS